MLGNNNIAKLVFIGLAVLSILFTTWKIKSISYVSESDKRYVAQKNTFHRMIDEISLNEVGDDRAPVNSRELFIWMNNKTWRPSSDEKHVYDYWGDGKFVDYWGNEIKVISLDGKFWGVASNGYNGVWENGMGDDVVVYRNSEVVN